MTQSVISVMSALMAQLRVQPAKIPGSISLETDPGIPMVQEFDASAL
jgi:hypothetical protein